MAELTQAKEKAAGLEQVLGVLRGISPIYIIVLVLMIAVGYMNPNFRDAQGVLQILRRAAPLMLLAAGQLFVIASGGLDLSIGSIVSLVVIGAAMLINNDDGNTWWVILALLGGGAVIGLINGTVVSYAKVPSLIATLGMLMALRGAGLFWSGGAPRGYLTDNFRDFGRGFIENVPLVERFPISVIVLILFGGLAIYLLHGTNFGRQVLAVGDNPRAARLSGVKIEQVRLIAFALSAVYAVIGGILLGGFAGVQTEAGDGMELQSISAAVLGGALLLGGGGSMPAVMAGGFALELLFTLLNLLGLPKPLRDAVQGLIIISAVAYAAYRSRRKS